MQNFPIVYKTQSQSEPSAAALAYFMLAKRSFFNLRYTRPTQPLAEVVRPIANFLAELSRNK